MERDSILKWLAIFCIGFIVILILELLDITILGMTVITIDGEQLSIVDLFFNSGYVSIHNSFLWVFLICISIAFIILSIILLRIALLKQIESKILSKFLLIIGIFFLMCNFIKIEFVYMLNKSLVDKGGFNSILMDLIYNQANTPFIGAIMWNYLLITSLSLLISGLIFGSVGLQWTLALRKEL